jgi:TonB family protein
VRNLLISWAVVLTLAGCAPMEEKQAGQASPIAMTSSESPAQTVSAQATTAQSIADSANAAMKVGMTKADRTPVLLHSVVPVVPPENITKQIAGKVTVEMWVEKDGSVSFVKILSSTDDLLSRAVTQALLQWKFSPLIEHGKPAAFKAKQEYKFDLQP